MPSKIGDLILIRVLPLGLFPQDRACHLRERLPAGDRWRPLRTVRLRWHVDQTWTKPRPSTCCRLEGVHAGMAGQADQGSAR
jgi:hypothetical protein